MQYKFQYLKAKFFEYSVIRWGLVGFTTNLFDYLLFLSIYYTSNKVFFSNFISVTIATSLNYYLNYKWTFHSQLKHSKSLSRYSLNLFFWWLVSTSLIKILLVLSIDPKIAKLAPLILIAPINFFILNYFIFRRNT